MLKEGRIYLGHLGSIPLYAHWTALFLVWQAFRWTPGGTNGIDFQLGVVLLLVLILSIVLHELGHGLAAKALGAFGIDITLWALGGLCSSKRASVPRRELAILAAGPAVSLLLTIASWVAFYFLSQHAPYLLQTGADPSVLAEFLLLSYAINKMLFIFNILPIFPLDGGQILYNLGLMATTNHTAVRRFTLGCAFAGAFGYLWWCSTGFTDAQGISFGTLFLVGWLVFNAYTHLR